VIYALPPIPRGLNAQLRELDRLRAELGDATRVPGAWLGQLRHQVRASSVETSVSIAGFSVPEGAAAALVDGSERAMIRTPWPWRRTAEQ
jgi:hypothetical protein